MTTISTRRGVDRELDVGPTGLDPDGADHLDRLVSELLIEAVGQRLRRGDRHRIAGVDTHRVDVLDRADDDDVVVAVAHQFELELAPPDHRLLDQDLVDRARGEALGDHLQELGLGVADASALAAHRERRADDRGQPDGPVGERLLDLPDRLDDHRPRHPQARLLHRGRGMPRDPPPGGSRRSRRRSARRRIAPGCRRRAADLARFSAVWPPSVGSSASGSSRSMIRATDSGVSGST